MTSTRLSSLAGTLALAVLANAAPAPAQTAAGPSSEATTGAQQGSAEYERAVAIMSDGVSSDTEWISLKAWELAATLSTPELAAKAREAAHSPDRYTVALAIETLARIDVAGNKDIFLGALGSPFRTVRTRAIRALSTLATPEVVHPLGKVVATDSDPDLRALAAEGLGRAGGPVATEVLRRALNDPAQEVREAAVSALVAAGDQEIGSLLIARLSAARDDSLCGVLKLVSLVPEPELIPKLAPWLDSPAIDIRLCAATAVLKLSEPHR